MVDKFTRKHRSTHADAALWMKSSFSWTAGVIIVLREASRKQNNTKEKHGKHEKLDKTKFMI